ncbi:DUF1405 domain-containing protein [Haloarchaeobius sp. HME9146]|uniref:DUF1405 domain-containing protein n=1 Tax=Haloarchaeobius sp. HME9146 TaxID=2978732 RepID=UPI0021C234EE|nr:DUF1405 domain-containing protein [Haloarchaeobius sp. HME9146]MCT9097681.1 DUF1405 domain-containing protein [Haloarchaeobius sp. HME9146]
MRGFADELPDRDSLPWYVAPVPKAIEDLGLRLVWLVVAINVGGTAFGFYYYGLDPTAPGFVAELSQFALEPLAAWPVVPDSPVATLFIALAFGAWALGRQNDYLSALAFFGCLKLGAWTPFVLLAFKGDFSYLHWSMYNFLFWSHLAMVLEGFVLHRITDFPVRAVAVALLWYGFNDLVDYFVPIVGTPHHTLIPAEEITSSGVIHTPGPHRVAAAGAVALTLLATFLSLSTRVKKLELDLE